VGGGSENKHGGEKGSGEDDVNARNGDIAGAEDKVVADKIASPEDTECHGDEEIGKDTEEEPLHPGEGLGAVE